MPKTCSHLMKSVDEESAKRIDTTIVKQTGDFLELLRKRRKRRLQQVLDFVEATARNRTADILITSEVLYRLSYGGLGREE